MSKVYWLWVNDGLMAVPTQIKMLYAFVAPANIFLACSLCKHAFQAQLPVLGQVVGKGDPGFVCVFHNFLHFICFSRLNGSLWA